MIEHASDCALHSEPAYPAGPCNCGAEMVERVARVLAQHQKERDALFQKALSPLGIVWGDAAYLARARCDARAAIGAMREPTETMIRHGSLVGEWMSDTDGDRMDGNADDVYRTMIDAALGYKS